MVMFAWASHVGAELGPTRHNKQHASVADPADHQFKQLECRWSSQCASSKMQSVGRCEENASSMSTSVLIVLFFICCGVRPDSSR